MTMRSHLPTPATAATDAGVNLDAVEATGPLARSMREACEDPNAGLPLKRSVRHRLEAALHADLRHVRVVTGARADAIATGLGADGLAAGSHVFLAAGRGDHRTPDGLRLLAHEVAHVAQQARLRPGTWPQRWPDGRAPAGSSGAELEADADRIADAVVRGHGVGYPGERVTPGAAPSPGPLLVQRHASWEHRLLGDQPTSDLMTIARNADKAARVRVLTNIRDFLGMWRDAPERVTPAMIAARYPMIRTLRLATSGLLVTYGELNTLPDYLPNPMVLDAQPASVMLPVLQAVRQEGYNRVNRMLDPGASLVEFAHAVSTPWSSSIINLIVETMALDDLTAMIGPARTNHYTALVGRNACHFAPYSWYRWQQFHLIARHLATQAHAARADADRSAWLTDAAWRNHGYADHFLQDSFAAGHLVNKNLVMQWFVEWAAGRWYVPVADWDQVKQITTATQPGLAAWGLYERSDPGAVRDPQTAEEQVSALARMTMAGVRGQGNQTQAQAYVSYLAFLNSTVVQSASGVLHDFYNATSLSVGSIAHPGMFQLWGDDTMLNGGDGVGVASASAHLSQQALLDLLTAGSTSISTQMILDTFPTTVQTDAGVVTLQEWNQGLRAQADALFPDVHYFVLRARPSIGSVSVDVYGGWVWQATPGSASAIAAGADGSVWSLAKEDVSGGHLVQKWNGSAWVTQTGSAVRIAVDPQGMPWVVNDSGTIFRLTSTGWQQLPGAGKDIACGPDGSVWLVTATRASGGYTVARWNGSGWDPMTGAVVRIAVGADGLPWAVNEDGAVFSMNADGKTWSGQPGSGAGIAIGQNIQGTPWLLSWARTPGGRTISSWGDGAWVPVEGGATEIAVDAHNVAWVVNDSGVVFRRGILAPPTTAGIDSRVARDAGADVLAAQDGGRDVAAVTLPAQTLDDSGRRVLALPPSAESVTTR